MSAHARQIAGLLVLALLIVIRIGQPGPFLPFAGGAPEPFPAAFAAAAPATPNAHADRPDVRVLQLLSSMNGMWDRAFAAAGADYRSPRIETRARSGEGCGAGTEAAWAGIYCFRGKRIVIDMTDHLVVRAAVGDESADDRLGYVLAHEVGHHVQNLREIIPPPRQEAVVRSELYAECLAGVWGRAAGRPLPAAWTYTGDRDHGTAAQQREWLERGHARGRPADCDAVWDADVLQP